MKPNKKLDTLIDRYYARLAEFGQQYVLHEGAVSEAFQTLLGDAARQHHWKLIPQLTDKELGKHIRPDGTLKHIFGLVRGHWEAEDARTSRRCSLSGVHCSPFRCLRLIRTKHAIACPIVQVRI